MQYIQQIQHYYATKVKYTEVMPDFISDEYEILLLFFTEKYQMQLLIGRQRIDENLPTENDGDGAIEEQSEGDQSSEGKKGTYKRYNKPSSNEADKSLMATLEAYFGVMVYDEDKDNDSPYFVKITINQQFLMYMEDPRIVEVQELKGQFKLLTENPVFIDIVRREVELNLGVHQKQRDMESFRKSATPSSQMEDDEDTDEENSSPEASPSPTLDQSLNSLSLSSRLSSLLKSAQLEGSTSKQQPSHIEEHKFDFSIVLHHQLIKQEKEQNQEQTLEEIDDQIPVSRKPSE